MSEALAVNSLPADRAPTLEEFAALHGVSNAVAAAMLTQKDAAQAVHEETKARALLAQPAIANRLVRILNGPDDEAAMTAMGILLKLSGGIKAPRPIQFSFDEMMKRAAAMQAGPLAGLTQITASAVIDAEDGDDNDNQ